MGETNWAGNHTFTAERIERPETVGELRRLVAASSRVKALGTRHSFSDVADFDHGVLIELDGLDTAPEIDRDAATLTVGAGTRYSVLGPLVHEAGFALENLASLPHCSVAGTVATATHGSGERVRNLATAVSALDLVTADGELRTFTRNDVEDFPGLVVSFGALGVITRLTLDLVPGFEVRQDGFGAVPWPVVLDEFDALQAAGYSVSLFTTWAEDNAGMVLLKRRAEPGDTFPVPEVLRDSVVLEAPPADNFTAWGVPGPWHERLPHFRPDAVPSIGEELQSEYFVPRAHAREALSEVLAMREDLAPALFVSEIRTIAGDDLWLSPCHGGDRVGIHFTWQPKPDAVAALLPRIEERLVPLGARPHWGKLFHGGGWLGDAYPELGRFRALADRLDPDGRFRSPFLRRHLFS